MEINSKDICARVDEFFGSEDKEVNELGFSVLSGMKDVNPEFFNGFFMVNKGMENVTGCHGYPECLHKEKFLEHEDWKKYVPALIKSFLDPEHKDVQIGELYVKWISNPFEWI